MKTTGTLPNSYTGKEIQINWFHASHWPGISEQWYNTLAAPCGAKPINVIRATVHYQERGKKKKQPTKPKQKKPQQNPNSGNSGGKKKSLWKWNFSFSWSAWFQFTNKYIILWELVLCSPRRLQRSYFQIKINNVTHTLPLHSTFNTVVLKLSYSL